MHLPGIIDTLDSARGRTVIGRLLIAATLVSSGAVLPDDLTRGEDIFDARCAHCHLLSRTHKMLDDVKPDDRTAYLKKFLRSHPNRLDEEDEDFVIRLLSTRSQ